jgi:hypothetical protein
MTSNSGSEIWCVKYPGGIFGKAGTPDVLCCVRGRFVAFEVKRSGGKRSRSQELVAAAIAAAGGSVHCVSSLQEVQDVVLLLLK